MMRAIQLRGQMPQAKRQREAAAAAKRVAALVHRWDERALDEADGILVEVIHAGVRPTEMFLAIADAAIGEEP